MLTKTRGIVISYLKFRETSIISKIYTEKLGLRSYIINGVRSKSSRQSLALFQPLTLLDLVVYEKKNQSNSGISRLSEYKNMHPFRTIPYDIKKTSIAIFITELLSKLLKEEAENHDDLFDFAFDAIATFDTLERGFESFHLSFMVKLARYIGFGLLHSNHHLVNDQPNDSAWTPECQQYLMELSALDFEHELPCTNKLRQEALDFMVMYYRDHIEPFEEMKSLEILRQLFS